MARPSNVRVMISSRCRDQILYKNTEEDLRVVRADLKTELEATGLLGEQLFDVWINEDAPPADGAADSWEVCLREVNKADVLLVLYNGHAGWAVEEGGVGICEAELEAALSVSPAKVRLIELPLTSTGSKEERARNQRFQAYVKSQNLFRGATCTTGEEVIARCKQALRAALVDMVKLGGREAKKGQYDRGKALDWSRLTFDARRSAMRSVLAESLRQMRGAEGTVENGAVIRIGGSPVLFVIDAVPAPMTVPAARELVGQPFLRDHESVIALRGEGKSTKSIGGPVHIIGCHRSVTEAQALKQLGFPDATIVSPPFGVWVADETQKIQMVFLENCRDETTTRHGVQRLFSWLEQSGEVVQLQRRAASRARIVEAIAKEIRS